MSVEDFRWIAEQCHHKSNQFALGGRGDPDRHKHFDELLQICRENDIVPTFTTSGYDGGLFDFVVDHGMRPLLMEVWKGGKWVRPAD